VNEGITNDSPTGHPIDTLCQGFLAISCFAFLMAQSNDGYGILILFSFLIYLSLATYRLVYEFDLSIMSGINASVIPVFVLSLLIWTVMEGDFFGDGVSIFIILIFITPLVLIVTLQEKFKDSFGWKKFVIGLFCSFPLSLLAVVVSLVIVIGFIEGNMDNF